MKETIPSGPSVNNDGRLKLQDLQLRGHAMFSSAGLPMGSPFIEYAWLMEILIGDIQGLLSFVQVSFDSFFFFFFFFYKITRNLNCE